MSWVNNLVIMSRAQNDEARAFYLFLYGKNNDSQRELERQVASSLFERTMISDLNNPLFMIQSTGLTVTPITSFIF